MSTSAIRSWMIVSSLRTVLWFIQRVVPASIFVNIKSRAFSRASRCRLISLISLTATPPLPIRPEVEPAYQPQKHNAGRILTSHAQSEGPADGRMQTPRRVPSHMTRCGGEWRIVRTAWGIEKSRRPDKVPRPSPRLMLPSPTPPARATTCVHKRSPYGPSLGVLQHRRGHLFFCPYLRYGSFYFYGYVRLLGVDEGVHGLHHRLLDDL